MTNKGFTFLNIFMLLFLVACTKPVDFDQASDLILEPVVESSIFFFNGKASDFFIGGVERTSVTDFVEIDIFNNSFIQENLIKLEFVFEVENSVNRAYELQLDFGDVNGNILESFIIDTPASPTNEIISSTRPITFENAELERIKQSRLIFFTLTMLPGDAITADSVGEIDVKSIGKFYLRIEG